MPHDLAAAGGGVFRLARPVAEPMLALGGQAKVRLALAYGDVVAFSGELRALTCPAGLDRLESEAGALQDRHGVRAAKIVTDAHPGYSTTRWAFSRAGVETRKIFHHHAHASAVAGEFVGETSWLCFTWDAAGLGEDGTLWGGEAFLGAPGAWARVATFRPFAPLGGEKAAREPWRSAAALAWAMGMKFAPPGEPHMALARAAWARQVNCPHTSAVGRLFDAGAAFLDLVHYAEHEAQGPMALEQLAGLGGEQKPVHLPLRRRGDGVLVADWGPLVALLCDDTRSGGARAYAFHASLAAALVAQAVAVRDAGHRFAVGLGGGVFQNRLLAGLVMDGLGRAGLRGFLPVRHACHDGGLSFGQVVEAAAA
jgi:hydrogenase maturation protein HypF